MRNSRSLSVYFELQKSRTSRGILGRNDPHGEWDRNIGLKLICDYGLNGNPGLIEE